MKFSNCRAFLVFILFLILFIGCSKKEYKIPFVSIAEQNYIIKTSDSYLDSLPVTVTSNLCDRSMGDEHDFYSEGDYWWPDPNNSDGPYIRKDGQTNPENFIAHRLAMIRLSRIVGIQTSAWLLTGDVKYVKSVQKHLSAWFINEDTRMNPSLNFAQAIKGRVTGRGIGIIDAIHLVEVSQSVMLLDQNNALSPEFVAEVKEWFNLFVTWLTTHEYGIKEMNTKNNHATCWVMQVGSFAKLSEREDLIDLCKERFKTILLPGQMAADGSFPQETQRTKPYGYSLFNLDAFIVAAEILSDDNDNLYEFTTQEGLNLRKGVEFLYPYVKNKSDWPFKKDVMYWENWPVRHPFLLFAGKAFKMPELIETWRTLNGYPEEGEVIRNLPVRNPLIWLLKSPVK